MTEATTVANVCEELALKILADDEIFLMFEINELIKPKANSVRGGTNAFHVYFCLYLGRIFLF